MQQETALFALLHTAQASHPKVTGDVFFWVQDCQLTQLRRGRREACRQEARLPLRWLHLTLGFGSCNIRMEISVKNVDIWKGAGIEEKSTRAGQPQTCNFVLQLFLNYLKNGYVGGRGGRAEGSKLNSRKYVECRFFETRPLTLLSWTCWSKRGRAWREEQSLPAQCPDKERN